MPSPKSQSHLSRRATCRSLASLTLLTCYPQDQCILSTKLPQELRNLIHTHLTSQQYNTHHESHNSQLGRRPGHIYSISTTPDLLLTCRLLYHEAHTIPLRSATFHISSHTDHPIYHMSAQQGREIYHLHDILGAFDKSNFTRFFRPHLRWKKVTWTICGQWMTRPVDLEAFRIAQIASFLAETMVPASC